MASDAMNDVQLHLSDDLAGTFECRRGAFFLKFAQTNCGMYRLECRRCVGTWVKNTSVIRTHVKRVRSVPIYHSRRDGNRR